MHSNTCTWWLTLLDWLIGDAYFRNDCLAFKTMGPTHLLIRYGFFYETRTTCTWELCNTCFLSLLSAGHKETRGSCYCPTQCNLTSFATTPSVASLSSFGVSELLDRNDKHVEDRLVTKCDFRRSAREGVTFLEIFTVAPWYKVHKDHHVMICIGNRVNLHLFLTILIMFFRWGNHDFIKYFWIVLNLSFHFLEH